VRSLRARRRPLALAVRRRPEWWVAAAVALAWLALLAGVGMGQMNMAIGRAGVAMAFWCTPAGMQQMSTTTHDSSLAMIAGLPGWSTMVVAMMVPVTLPAVRHVALNSMRHRRKRAMALYTTVYVGCWALFGIGALATEEILTDDLGIGARALLALALAAAACWQLTRAKRRALFACGRTVPLPPHGRRADAGCARFALLQAQRCIVSCWAIMLVMVAAGASSLAWMGALTGLVLAEELTIAGRRLTRPAAGALAAAALAVALSV
jgi:predicted metal-binding membrane protein